MGAFTYYPDGSLKSDANRGISNIVYNYLGLQDRIEFGSNKRIENVYDAEGLKLIQRLVNGTTVIQTDYMGGLIYRNDTLQSIAHDEGISRPFDATNSNFQPHFFYNDHLGNTRLIYSIAPDGAYITQENQSNATPIRPMGELLEGLGQSGDWKFLYQGKEFIDGLGYDFHARNYDAWRGQFDGIDAVDHYGMSGYAGMGNNPVNVIDPDGNNPIAIGFMIGLFASSIGHITKGTMPTGMWDFLRPGLIGGISGGLGAMAPIGILPGAAYGAGTGAGIGALNAGLSGGNIGMGELSGGITGGILGGVFGGIEANGLGANIWTGQRPAHYMLSSEALSVTGQAAPYTDEYLNDLKNLTYSDVQGVGSVSKNWMPKGWKSENGSFVGPDGIKAMAVTKNRVWRGGSKSSIYFSESAFSSKEQLAYTMAHEMGHVIHSNIGMKSIAQELTGRGGLLDNEGHVAIQTMTFNLIRKNGWQNMSGQAYGFFGLSPYPKLLNPIMTLSRKIIFPK